MQRTEARDTLAVRCTTARPIATASVPSPPPESCAQPDAIYTPIDRTAGAQWTVVKPEPGSRVWGTATHVFVLTDAAVLHGIR